MATTPQAGRKLTSLRAGPEGDLVVAYADPLGVPVVFRAAPGTLLAWSNDGETLTLIFERTTLSVTADSSEVYLDAVRTLENLW